MIIHRSEIRINTSYKFITSIQYIAFFIFLHSCCKTLPTESGYSKNRTDACCHSKGFEMEEPEWRCNKDHGSGNALYNAMLKANITY